MDRTLRVAIGIEHIEADITFNSPKSFYIGYPRVHDMVAELYVSWSYFGMGKDNGENLLIHLAEHGHLPPLVRIKASGDYGFRRMQRVLEGQGMRYFYNQPNVGKILPTFARKDHPIFLLKEVPTQAKVIPLFKTEELR